MSLLRNIRRLQYIDLLIKKKATGTPDVFAKKNHLSKRGLLQVLQEMKEMGFPIRYSRMLNTYFYDENLNDLNSPLNELLLSRKEASLLHEGVNLNDLCFSEVDIFQKC